MNQVEPTATKEAASRSCLKHPTIKVRVHKKSRSLATRAPWYQYGGSIPATDFAAASWSVCALI